MQCPPGFDPSNAFTPTLGPGDLDGDGAMCVRGVSFGGFAGTLGIDDLCHMHPARFV